MKIHSAVIPAAGFGTRLLPATKSIPKVMLPIVDRPAIHLCVEEAVKAGIERIIFVLSPGQESVIEYFRGSPDVERVLAQRGEFDLLRAVREIADMADFSFVYQEERLGLGHAVLMARNLVDNEPFAVLLPDDLMWSDRPAIGEMMKLHDAYESSVLAVTEVPKAEVHMSGIIDAMPVSDGVSRVIGIVEKPDPADAPSNLAITGRYVLTPEVFDAIQELQPGAGGEIQLTDAIAMVLPTQAVYAYHFPGVHIDVGTPLGLIKASVHAAMRRPDMAGELRAWLAEMLGIDLPHSSR